MAKRCESQSPTPCCRTTGFLHVMFGKNLRGYFARSMLACTIYVTLFYHGTPVQVLVSLLSMEDWCCYVCINENSLFLKYIWLLMLMCLRHHHKISYLTSCFWQFHVNCIDPWLRQQGTCPICKHQVSDGWHGAGNGEVDASYMV